MKRDEFSRAGQEVSHARIPSCANPTIAHGGIMSGITQQVPSPSDYFDFTLFGAVDIKAESTRILISLTPAERQQFDRAVAYFRHPDNGTDAVLSLPFPSEAAAKEFRAKLRAFADSRDDINVSFPKRSDNRWSVTLTAPDETTVKRTLAEITKLIGDRDIKARAKSDDGTHTVTLTSTREGLAKDIYAQARKMYANRPVQVGDVEFVKGNGYSAEYNVGTNVTFRLPQARKANPNGKVTVTSAKVTVTSAPVTV